MIKKKEKLKWKVEIDNIHQKHLNYIHINQIDELAYHYTSPTGLLGILSNKNIWFTDCDYLNDSSESNYFSNLYSQVFSSFPESSDSKHLTFLSYLMVMFHSKEENSSRQFLSRESERRYVLSFSVDEDALSLWNNYTKTVDSTGYNIGFNIEKLRDSIFLKHNQKLFYGRVIYSKVFQMKLLNELISDYLYLYRKYKYSYQRKYLYDAIENNLLIYSVFMKDEPFKCENEFRIVILEKGAVSSELTYREKNGAFIPYIVKTINLKSISSIMISPTTRADFVKSSVKSMANYFELDKLEVKSSSIPLRY